MRARTGEIGDDAELGVASATGPDARGTAHPRVGAVRADHQFRRHHAAVLEIDFDAVGA